MEWGGLLAKGLGPSHYSGVETLPALQFGAVTLVPDERLLFKGSEPVSLTPKAFDLLTVLAANPGWLLTKEQLLQAVWSDTSVEESNLSYHVFAIRRALGDTAEGGQIIETVPKRGYRFTAPVVRVDRPNPLAGTAGDSALIQTEPTAPSNGAIPQRIEASAALATDLGSRPLKSRNAWRLSFGFVVGALCAGAGVLVGTRHSAAPLPLIRAQMAPGVQLSEASPFALSPDGLKLVFAGRGPDGVTRLWLRHVGDETARPLNGTEALLGGLVPPMFWSPDGDSIAFDALGQLKRYDLRESAVRTICAIPGLAVGGSWSAAGVVLVGQPNGAVLRCNVADGRVSEATRLDPAKGKPATCCRGSCRTAATFST